MPPVKTDVKPNADASSAAATDVKPNFESEANKLIDSLVAGASPEKKDESESISKLENDEEESQQTESEETKTEEVEEQPTDKKPEGEVEDDEGEDTEEDDKDDKQADGQDKSKQTVPFSRFEEVNSKVKSLEPLAKSQQELVTFCQQNGISQEQYRDAMHTLALINTNPKEALKKINTLTEQLKVAAEEGLPSDLQAAVDEGTLPEKYAKELAKSRLEKTQLTRQSQTAQEQAAYSDSQALLNTMSQWAASKAKTNPDFKPKSGPNASDGVFEVFVGQFTQRNAMQPPQSHADYIRNAEEAYESTIKFVESLTTSKRPIKTLSSQRSTRPEKKKPTSMDDVANEIIDKYVR